MDWRPQAEAYVSVYDQLSGFFRPGPAVPPVEARESDCQGRGYVDLDDEAEFSRFLLGCRAPVTGEAEVSPPRR
jgi:hypothetical protein